MNSRGFHRIFAVVAFLLCFLPAQAAQPKALPPPERPPIAPFVPELRVRGAERPVRLQTLAVHISIQSGFAEVGLDMTFFNPNARILEGELQFPLLSGQEISGLALDIQGEMRNGVPVPKARGQEIFDAVARRNVDPALLEATRGNAYKLRLYPIPAKGSRRVMVRIMEPLTARDGMLSLRLPLAFAKHIDNFSVEVVVAAGEPPAVESGALGLALRRTGLLYQGKVEKTDLSPEGWLTIAVPADAADKGFNAVRWRDRIYFAATASVETQTRKRALPKLVTLVWDASGSGRNRDHAREYALLDEYFAALGDGRARLIVVRNASEAPKEFPIREGDWSGLKAYLHRLDYDGGTDLASWRPTDDCAEYLLFTDGLANFGDSLGDAALPALASGQRLYAVTSSSEADHNLLRHASQGRLVDLLRNDGAAAARSLLEDGTRASLAPEDLAGRGEALLDPLAAAAENADRLQCRLAGWVQARADAKAETITLRLEHPDGRRESVPVVVPLAATIPAHEGEDAPLPARLWGRYAIAEMEANASRHAAAIARLGRELGVVSRETSLIVLETAEDYVRYDVEPPASLAAKVEELRVRGGDAAANAYLPTERLLRMWEEKVAWWRRDFPEKPAQKRKPRAGRDEEIGAEDRFARMDMMPSASFARTPAPAAPPASASLGVAPEPDMEMPSVSAMRSEPPEARIASDKGGDPGAAIGIAIQAWTPDAPYIERMDKAKTDDMYAIYLDERPGYARSAGFYLDTAGRFFAARMPELGLRVLSNLAEIEIENRQLLRVLAYRLLEIGQARPALGILEKVRGLAPYEPQSLRDLAAAHAALGDPGRAADLLYEVARRKWDERFGDINVIALTELNAILAAAGKAVDAAAFDSRLILNLASDLRVVLAWDADDTDMDLWVTDPDGEKCDYGNRLTGQGGALSRDCTAGYGPEEFMLRKAKPGTYRVEVEYYGSGRQIPGDEVTLYVTLTTGFGAPGQKEQAVTMRLAREKRTVLVGEFTVE